MPEAPPSPTRPRLLGHQPLQILRDKYGFDSYEEYEKRYQQYAALCLGQEAKAGEYIAAVSRAVSGLAVLSGNAAYDRIVAPVHNELFVYCPIVAAQAGKWALFEELFREYAEMVHLQNKIRRAMRLPPEEDRIINFLSALGLSMQQYVFIVTAGGRKIPMAGESIDSDPGVLKILHDISECPVCFNQNSKWNSSCVACERYVCADCSQQLDKCPFCRSSAPRWDRGLDREAVHAMLGQKRRRTEATV
jgi:hypothetical protein